jgi:hypothetical protein
MKEGWQVLWSNLAIAIALLIDLAAVYFFLDYSDASVSDEIGAIAFVYTSLAIFEFGRFVDRHNRQNASLRAKRRILSVDQSRNLVAITALAVSCAVDASSFDWDEVVKVIGFAALIAIIEIVKAVAEDFAALAKDQLREMARAVWGKFREKLADFVVSAVIALISGWIANRLAL